jgi:hypothetical protein
LSHASNLLPSEASPATMHVPTQAKTTSIPLPHCLFITSISWWCHAYIMLKQ